MGDGHTALSCHGIKGDRHGAVDAYRQVALTAFGYLFFGDVRDAFGRSPSPATGSLWALPSVVSMVTLEGPGDGDGDGDVDGMRAIRFELRGAADQRTEGDEDPLEVRLSQYAP